MTHSFGKIFPLLGILLLLAAFVIGFKTLQQVNTSLSAKGTVADILSDDSRHSGKALITFTTLTGEQAEFYATNWLKSKYSIGDTVDVLYQPGALPNGRVNSFFSLYLLPAILAMIGLDLLIFSFILNHSQQNLLERKKLVQTGQSINATYQNFRATSYRGSLSPARYYAEANWTDESTQKKYYFTSESVVAEEINTLKNGQNVIVYIDPKNPKHYYFDLQNTLHNQ